MQEELIKRAIEGDNRAFSELILYYKNDMYKIAYARLNNIEDINDVIQESIFNAYKYVKNIRNISSFKPWLIKILINECNKIYIQKERHKHISIDDIDYKTDNSSLNDENIEFDDIMKFLNIDERTILILYYSEGYKVKEISQVMQINENTVKTKLARARKKLEEILKEDEKYGNV